MKPDLAANHTGPGSEPRRGPGDAPGGSRASVQTRRYRTVGEVLSWTEDRFRSLGIPTARLDAELLLASALRTGRLELYMAYAKPLEPEERLRYRELVKRRCRREPVAYLLGEREFYSLSFKVSPAVLIPRPETEHVVEAALEGLRETASASSAPRVLDLGTGSGNLAVAIAANQDNVLVDGVDISPAALDVARENAARHGLEDRIRFLEGDFFDPVRSERGAYQLIVSNPPYVRGDEVEELMPDVRLHEPREALVDSRSPTADGLGSYRAIAARAGEFLAPGGSLVVETGAGQAAKVRELFREGGLPHLRTVKDYGGIDRVVIARR